MISNELRDDLIRMIQGKADVMEYFKAEVKANEDETKTLHTITFELPLDRTTCFDDKPTFLKKLRNGDYKSVRDFYMALSKLLDINDSEYSAFIDEVRQIIKETGQE